MTPALAAILSECTDADGRPRPVAVIENRMPRGLWQTHAERTLERILSARGEGHLRFVLATMLQTENNADALVAPVIEAVSDAVACHPEWSDRAGAWLAAFDGIRLMEVYQAAKDQRAGAKLTKTAAVYMALCARLEAALGAPSPQKDLFG